MKKALPYLLLFFFFCGKIFSTHIVGGEIFYDRLNDSTYKVTLKLYRDCFNGLAPFPGINDGSSPFTPAILTVFNTDSILVNTYDIGAPIVTNIPHTINNPCIQPPTGFCVEEGLYTYTLTLPPKAGGYYLVFQVAFRNNTILNLLTPGQTGATYYTFIPGPEVATINNSPRYASFPPIFICNNVTFTFDHKAIDPDGDQLVYSLCSPFDGQAAGQAPPPPYANVNYVSPYNGGYPVASSPAFSIDPVTGILTGKPNIIGQFVVGVCVQEFKGGTLINTHMRDFQFNVVSCIVNVVSAIANQKSQCEGTTITFTNTSSSNIGALAYHWDFGDPALTNDTSNLFSPTYTYQDTGKYVVTLVANPNKPCSDTLKDTLYVYPLLDVNFPPVNKQCFKGNAFTFSAQGSYVPYATFNWTFTSAATPSTSTLQNPSNIHFNQPGKYLVKLVAKQYTCIDSFIDSVRIVRPPVAKINNLPTILCDPATVALSNGSSSDLPVTYQWFFSNGSTSQEFQPVQVFTPPGVYSASLVVQTASVCVDTSIASVSNITVNPTPKAGFTFSPQVTTILDPEITFMNSASSDVISWQYTFGDGAGTTYASSVHEYKDYGDYIVSQTVINSFGCIDTTSQLVKILPEFRFWIPNTFTPDGNSHNDYFMPVTIGAINFEFDIYTRWGELIYKTQTPNEGWNGFYKGKECQEDVYAWRVIFKNIVTMRDEIHYGHVVLLNNK
ncbi:MAG: PKD domain-containing protein [Bacteroidia bacterium]